MYKYLTKSFIPPPLKEKYHNLAECLDNYEKLIVNKLVDKNKIIKI